MTANKPLITIPIQVRQSNGVHIDIDPAKSRHQGIWIRSPLPAHWLRWVTANCLSPEAVGIHPLPDRQGVLLLWEATGPNDQNLLSKRPASTAQLPLALPLRQLADKYWTLRDATIQPQLTDVDWEKLSISHAICFLHPTIGLLCVDPIRGIKLPDLFSIPHSIGGNWDRAVEAPCLPERLISIAASAPPALEQWLENTGRDLGNQRDSLPPLPPTQREGRGKPIRNAVLYAGATVAIPVAAAVQLTERLLRGIASTARKMLPARSAKGAGTGGTVGHYAANESQWLQQMREWAKRQVNAFNEMIEANRNSAVHRLLSMLEDNPDEGLKYAIPMSQDDLQRGRAAPGDQLTRNRLGWGSIGSTGAADPWDIEARVRAKLIARYRELAEREERLGRFERAAYIYARLLSDFSSAGHMLMRGELFREAGVVYRDKLKNESKAAECFRRAGDFQEALRLLRGLGSYVEAGDLLTEMGQSEEATAEYRRYVDFCDRNRRWPEAADCLVQKLNAPEEALTMLRTKWPRGVDNEKCFRKTISLLQELGRTAEISDDIERLLAERDIVANENWPIEALVSIDQFAKSTSLSNQARAAVFRAASYSLQSISKARVSHATHWLRTVLPEDPIFARDTLRYAIAVEQNVPKSNTTIALRRNQLTSVASVTLDKDVEWFYLAKIKSGLLAVGRRDDELCVQLIQERASHAMLARKTSVLPVRLRSNSEQPWIRHRTASKDGVEKLSLVVGNTHSCGDLTWLHDIDLDHPLGLNMVLAGERVLDFCTQPTFQSAMTQHRTGILQSDNEATIASYLVRSLDDIELHSVTDSFASRLECGTQHYFDDGTHADFASAIFNTNSEFTYQGPDRVAANADVWRIAQVRDLLAIANGSKLVVIRNNKLVFSQHFGSGVTQLLPAPTHTRPRVLLTTQRGVAVQWMHYDNWKFQSIVERAYRPQAIYMRDGKIVVAHDTTIEVFSNRNHEAKLDFESSGSSDCKSLCLHENINFFYLLDSAGQVTLWSTA